MSQPPSNSGIITWFTLNPVAANLLMLLVIMLGAFSIGDLRREAFPSREPDTVTVQVSYSSGSARQSEQGVALLIEEALETVQGINTLTTVSTGSTVVVSAEKLSEYDIDVLYEDIKATVDTISSFPSDADQPVIEKAQRSEHAIYLQLYGDVDRRTLQNLAESLKTDLLADSDVGEVSINGTLDPVMRVEVDEGKLQSYGLTLSDVSDAIDQESTSTESATITSETMYLQLQSSKQAYQVSEFSNLVLKTYDDGSQILVKDVADVYDTFDTSTSVLGRFNGSDSISLQVFTTGQTDITDSVIAANKVAQQWIDSGRLPNGVELATWYDRSKNINERLDLLTKNAMTGIFWVFLMLAIFLNLSVAFWVAMGLPFIFFGSMFLMGDSFLGMSLNAFTTFGFIMALGIVVDDAVVVGESVYSERSKYGDTVANTISGTLRVAVPTLFGVFTTVAACFALSNLEGRLGTLYAQFGTVVTLCLLLSIVESKLILPAHLAHLNTRPKKSRFWPMMLVEFVQRAADMGLSYFTQRIYKPAIAWAISYRYAVLLLFLSIFLAVITMPMTGALRISFFPSIPGDTIRANLTMQNDASFGQTHKVLLQMERLAYETEARVRPEGETSSSIANMQVRSSDDQSGLITVQFRSDAALSTAAFVRAWQKEIGTPEGVRRLRIQSRRGGVDALRIELKSSDEAELQSASDDVLEYLGSVEAVYGIEDNAAQGQALLNFDLTEQGRLLGLTTQELSEQLLSAFNNQKVQSFQRDNDEVEVQIGYPQSSQNSIASLSEVMIQLDNGSQVPLGTLVNVSSGFTDKSIVRIDTKRAIYISAEVDKDLMSSTELVEQLQTVMVPELKQKYLTLDVNFAGEARERAETQSSMVNMFAAAMLVIYILLAIPLKSYVQPVLIMMAIPFGIVGAMLGHWTNELSISILSLNGIIALSGVVVNDSLLLVSRFNEIRHKHDSIPQAISDACRSRVRAVLLTSITTFVGLMPLLGETSRQAQFLIPAAVSLGYGIMYATVITLILIPVLIMIHEDVKYGLKSLKDYLMASKKSDLDEASSL